MYLFPGEGFVFGGRSLEGEAPVEPPIPKFFALGSVELESLRWERCSALLGLKKFKYTVLYLYSNAV